MTTHLADGKHEVVFILHGLGANRLVMSLLAIRMRRRGYHVVNWGYGSTRRTVESHAERLCADLARYDYDPPVERIHLVVHSMGSIVARQALLTCSPAKLGRVVMLAPPNRGSRVATLAAPYVGGLCAAVRQLATHDDSFVCRLGPPVGVEFGVIGATYDIMVAEPSTHLDGEADHIVFPCMHTSLVFRRDVADQVAHFLAEGKFKRAQVTAEQAAV